MTYENSKFAGKDVSGLAASPAVIDPVAAPDATKQAPDCSGRLGPAGIALVRGLTARTMLPDGLRLRTEHFDAEFRRELRPAGILENVLVSEIARHAAGMELAANAERSILRFCGQQELCLDPDGQTNADASVTAAIANPAIERHGRYRQLHEGAFYRALSRLRDLQATRQASTVHAQFANFRSEEDCQNYLFKRARRRAEGCPRCGGRNGNWLARRRWECSACGLQVGIRCGSVMERSRLPLLAWFVAIGGLLADPQIGVERLQEMIGLPRLGTVRKLQQKILAAIESPDVDCLLAGLQRLAPGAGPPEFSDAWDPDLAKRP